MASPLLDFKKFKHVKSDDKTTTLQHDDGHTLMINHKSLSKDNQAQLKALAGMSKGKSEDKKEEPKQKYAEGTDYIEQLTSGENDQSNPPMSSTPPPSESPPSAPMDAIPTPAPAPQDTRVQSDASPDPMQTPKAVEQQQIPESTEPVVKEPSDPALDHQMGLESAESSEIQGAQGKAKAIGDLGKQQEAIQQKQAQAQQTALEHFQAASKQSQDEYDNFVHDIQNSHVDPENYWKDHSKIATGIGIILGGFNPTNNPNAAIGFLNHQMDRNLEAQAKDLGRKENLLSANLNHFKNLKDAADMTRLQQEAIVTHQLEAAAAKAQDPMAKANALAAIGQIKREYAPLKMQMDARRAMMSLSNSTNENPSDTSAYEHGVAMLQMVNPESAKQYRELLVPGVGVAKIAPPPAAREEMIGAQKLINASKDLMNYSKTHNNTNPLSAEHTYGVTKAMILQQNVREGLLGTVFRESEKPLLEKFINENPASAFKTFTTQPKLKAIIDSTENNLNVTKAGYGIPVHKGMESGSSAPSTIERLDPKTGKTVVYDAKTKKPLRFK